MTSSRFSLEARVRMVVYACFGVGAVLCALLLVPQINFGADQSGPISGSAAILVVVGYGLVAHVCAVLICNLVINQFNLMATRAEEGRDVLAKQAQAAPRMVNIDRGLVEILLDEEFSAAWKRHVPTIFRRIEDYGQEPYDHALAIELEETLAALRSSAWSSAGTMESLKQDIFRHLYHQLKSPMAVVRSHTNKIVAALDADPPDIRKIRASTTGIDEAAMSVVKLVDHILHFASVNQASRHGFRTEPVDLLALAREVAITYIELADEREIGIAPGGDTFAILDADENLIRQLMSTLVENSIKYADAGGEIDILAHSAPDYVEIVVEDLGPGIPAAQRVQVLNPFYGFIGKDDLGRHRYGERKNRSLKNLDRSSHGLGLSLANDIVKLHKGFLSLEDRPDGKRGLRVVCRFPRSGR